MTAELGVFFLIIALGISLLQASFLLPSPALRARLLPCLLPASLLQALCVTLAFVTLVVLRLSNDFSVMNVITHSNAALPMLYKITGSWGNHEGSMLLWVLVISGFGLALCLQRGELLHHTAVAVQSLLGAGVLLFILLTSNPFARQFPPTQDGEMLNPLLQDIALAMHPPLLYIGYVGFSITFSLAVGALLTGKADRHFAALLHPWIMAAWSALTIGIGLGSWWAYRELGWGGWWFWDPVENASLMPWLAGTALLHSNIVLKKRGLLAQWVVLLSIITFGLSLIGTFLVRSGALTSVHSFASDPSRGMFILGYMTLAIGGALLLYALRASKLSAPDEMLPLSREGVIVINNLFLLTACTTVLLGTLYPLLVEWLDDSKLTVGPPFFNATFIPLMAIPLLFAGLAPLMPWKKAALAPALRRARPALFAALAASAIIGAVVHTEIVYAMAGFGLGAWLAASSVQWLITGRGVKGVYSVFLGHLGVAILVAGITGVSIWKQEREQWAKVGESIAFAGYHFTYAGESPADTENYTSTRAEITITTDNGGAVATLFPEYRRYKIRGTGTSEAAILSRPFYDVYAVIGEASPDGARRTVRLYYMPWISFIWLGCVVMTLGGGLALMRRRHD